MVVRQTEATPENTLENAVQLNKANFSLLCEWLTDVCMSLVCDDIHPE